jgi:hypothetical protein
MENTSFYRNPINDMEFTGCKEKLIVSMGITGIYGKSMVVMEDTCVFV